MKRFFQQIFLFFLVSALILLFGILLPATPMSKNNMLSYKTQKDSLLENVKSPRIIFVGGSNLPFGLNSQMIKDSLNVNPINTGLAVNIGLIYMMDDVLPYIRKGDRVVLSPEYNLFYGNSAYGGKSLFRLLMDVDRAGFSNLRLRHYRNFIETVPYYFLSKFDIQNYFYNGEGDVYGKQIFNEYGDSEFHWNMEKQNFPVINQITTKFDDAIIGEIVDFNSKIEEKGATLFITYPGCQKASLNIIKEQVNKIQEELEKTELTILGTPQRYSFQDSLMFNQAYHLSKKGMDLRTQFLIEDLKYFIRNNK